MHLRLERERDIVRQRDATARYQQNCILPRRAARSSRRGRALMTWRDTRALN